MKNIIVGKYIERFNVLSGQNLPCDNIYQSEGLIVHLKNHHPNETDLIESVPDIISHPDYVGHNQKENDSIELVKRLSNNVMVCVKLDRKENYLYVASVFSISDKKLMSRIESGRLKHI